jgi:hypothetical protein
VVSGGVGAVYAGDPIFPFLTSNRGTRDSLYGYAMDRPLLYTDPLGLCSCLDECPSGLWDYVGLQDDIGFIVGLNLGFGRFRCRGRAVQVSARFVCGMIGGFAGGGAGGDFSLPFSAPGLAL